MTMLSLQFLWFSLLGFVLVSVANAQTCEKLDPKLFSSCVSIGHNQTFKLPSSVDKNRIANLLRFLKRLRSNCTTPLDGLLAVDCAIFVPFCKEGRSTPFLPCRRVCAEMIHGCYNKKESSRRGGEYMGSWCNALPDSTAASGKCFEPKTFKPTVNESVLQSLGKCHKRLLPTCGDQGYGYTILSNNSQAKLFKFLFNKTADWTSLNASDYALPSYFEDYFKNYSTKCVPLLRKYYCGINLPPCFPERPKKHFGFCKSFCHELAKECPHLFKRHPEELELCGDFPDGESYKGFCVHTTWPKSTPFTFWFRKRKPKGATKKPTKLKPGVIAAAVIVPVVVLVALAVAAVFLVRRYNITRMAYRRQRDDVVSIVES